MALLVAMAMPTLSYCDKFATYMRLVEQAVPFLAAVMGAYSFAPDNEPSIELLLTYPRPLWHSVLERLSCMAAMLAVSSMVSGSFFLMLAGQLSLNNLAQLAVVLVPSTFCTGTLSLAITIHTARGTVGLLFTLILCLTMAALPDELLAALPILRWVYIFPFGRYGLTWASWLVNRLTLIALGVLVSIGALHFTRNSERLLRI